MSKMEILEKAGSTDILILLTKHKGKMYLTKLHEDLGKGSMSTLNMRLLELKNQGLIKDEQESKFGGRRYIWLTEKGEKIAKHLLDIENIL
ncbi:MAG: winged helix-turn-helix transcriptional regulator [Thermoplasmatota archaeon]